MERHVRQSSDRPFFLYHATQAVHLPSFPAARFQGKTPAGPHGDFIFELDWIVLGWLGWEARDLLRLNETLEPLLGARYTLAACIHAVLAAVYFGLYLVTFLVIARVLLKRTWLAALVTVAATMPVYLPQMGHPGISWIPLGIVLVVAVWAAVRYGLVVVACATLIVRLLLTLPLDPRPGAWAWEMTVFVLLVVVGIAAYGFVFARRPARAAAA